MKHIKSILDGVQAFGGSVQKFATDNAPSILTGVGIAGTVTTAYLTGKGAFKASHIIHMADNEWHAEVAAGIPKESEVTTLDKAKLTWLCYLPAAGAGAATIGAIFFANRINTKRIAALAVAYSASDRAYTEYKEKVEKHLGKNKEQKVRDEIAQDRTKTGNGGPIYLASDGGKHLCYEMYMGHYTKSSMEGLKSLRNEMNDTMLRTDYVSLSDWYNQLGIPTTPASDNLGWRSDGGLIELDISTTISDGDEPCLAFEFRPEPYPNFHRAH